MPRHSLIPLVTTFVVLGACKDRTNDSEAKINVPVPIPAADQGMYEAFYKNTAGLMAGEELPLKITDLILIKLSASEAAKVDQAHPNPVTVSCQGGKCTGISQGQEVTVPLSLESSASQMWLASEVRLQFRMFQDGGQEKIEICRASGMKFKQGFFWAPFDGALVTYDAATPGKVVNMTVDVGVAGSYPSADCD